MLEKEIERCEWVKYWTAKTVGVDKFQVCDFGFASKRTKSAVANFLRYWSNFICVVADDNFPTANRAFREEIDRLRTNTLLVVGWLRQRKARNWISMFMVTSVRQVENHYLLGYYAQTWEKIVLTLLYKKTQSGDAGRFLVETKRQLKQKNQFPESCSIKVWMNQEFRSGPAFSSEVRIMVCEKEIGAIPVQK